MNFYRAVLVVLFLLVFAMAAMAEGLSISLQTQFSKNILQEVCSHESIDREQIRNSEIVQDMVTHFGRMRSEFTMEHYIDARVAAANCEIIGNDIYRFGQVINKRKRLLDAINAISLARITFSDRVSQLIQPLMPKNLKYNGHAVLMIGSPSCGGWAVGQTFYVDVPCLNGDQEGLLYLVAHE